MKLSEVKETGTTILAKGPEGSGKSHGLASWPGRTLIVDLDLRARSLVDTYKNREDDFEIEQFGPYEYEKFCDFWSALQDRCDYDNVFLDGLTALVRMLINYSLGLRNFNNKMDKGMGKSEAAQIKIPQFEDWNAENNGLNKIISIGRNLSREKNVNFFMSAHLIETNIKAPTGGFMQRLLTGAKAVAHEIPGYFNEIWIFNAGPDDLGLSTRYSVRVRPSVDNKAKTTMKALPDEFDFTDKNLYEEVKRLVKANTVIDPFAKVV